MGVLVEYFVAADDQAAARTVDWPGGPGRGGPARRWPRQPEPALPVVDAPGIEPFIALAALEELLTGRTWDEQQRDPSSRPVVAERDAGERLVVRIGDALVGAVAGADDARLAGVVGPWADTEEFRGAMDPAVLARFAAAFRDLAGRARAADGGVYCWVCV